MNDPWKKLLPLILENLPASVDSRAEVLEAVVSVIPRAHAARAGIVESYTALNRHIGLQREISFPDRPAPVRPGGSEFGRGSARLGDTPLGRGSR